MSYFHFFVDPDVYSTSDGYGDGYAIVSKTKTGLLQLLATNQVSATRFVQVFDGYVQPSAGAKPVCELQVDGYTQGVLSFLPAHWLPLKTGLVVASSTTSATYTAGGSTDLFLTVLSLYR